MTLCMEMDVTHGQALRDIPVICNAYVTSQIESFWLFVSECFEGKWNEGKREGEGIMEYPNGYSYKGFWLNDRPLGNILPWIFADIEDDDAAIHPDILRCIANRMCVELISDRTGSLYLPYHLYKCKDCQRYKDGCEASYSCEGSSVRLVGYIVMWETITFGNENGMKLIHIVAAMKEIAKHEE